MNFEKHLQKALSRKGVPLLSSLLITAVFISVTLFTARTTHKMILEGEKLKVQSELGIIRAKIEGALNSRLLLGRGLASYISIKPSLSAEEFRLYAEKLYRNDKAIRNISILKGTTIIYAYPLEGNRQAIGVDLAKIPAQRDSVLKAIETGEQILIPRVNLVQGGIATITRIPVFISRGEDRKYWGQISVVLMQDALFREAELHHGSHGLKISMHAENNNSEGVHLFGEKSLNQAEPVELDIIFPYGRWKIQAIPIDGWGYSDTTTWKIIVAGLLISFLLGGLVYTVAGFRVRISQLESILPICSNCKKIRGDEGSWSTFEHYLNSERNVQLTHGICPECVQKLYGDHEWSKKINKS